MGRKTWSRREVQIVNHGVLRQKRSKCVGDGHELMVTTWCWWEQRSGWDCWNISQLYVYIYPNICLHHIYHVRWCRILPYLWSVQARHKWIYLTLRTATQQVRYLKSPTKISSDLEKNPPPDSHQHILDGWYGNLRVPTHPPTGSMRNDIFTYLKTLYKSTIHVGVLWESTSSQGHENPLDNSSDRLGGFWTCEGLGGLGNGLLAVHPGKLTWNIK